MNPTATSPDDRPIHIGARSIRSSPAQNRRRIATGALTPLFRGVAIRGDAPPTFEQRAVGAAMRYGGIVSHASAARLHGFRSWTMIDELHVSLPSGRPRSTAGITVHRREGLGDDDVVAHPWGVPMTSVEVTLLDIAFDAPEFRLRSAYHDVWNRGVTTPQRIAAVVDRLSMPGRPGGPRLRAVLDRYASLAHPARSINEFRLFDAVHDRGLDLPQLNHPVERPSGRAAFLDVAWPSIAYAIEVDHSFTHSDPEQWRDDAVRQGELQQAGWIIDRFAEDQLGDGMAEVVDHVQRRLADLSGRRFVAR